jgi:hypothetical protein
MTAHAEVYGLPAETKQVVDVTDAVHSCFGPKLGKDLPDAFTGITAKLDSFEIRHVGRGSPWSFGVALTSPLDVSPDILSVKTRGPLFWGCDAGGEIGVTAGVVPYCSHLDLHLPGYVGVSDDGPARCIPPWVDIHVRTLLPRSGSDSDF